MNLLARLIKRVIGDATATRIRDLLRSRHEDRAIVAERHLQIALGNQLLAERSLLAARLLLCGAGLSDMRLITAAQLSRSQLGQDLFALHCSGNKRNGFFVEFGAGDGQRLSNTIMLEQEFGWRGILAEPLNQYHESLRASRTAAISTDCVWSESGKTVEFVESGYLSTVIEYRDGDHHALGRANGRIRPTTTISLLDLLRKHDAPQTIDFLSIDTEGSEYHILEAFPFGVEYNIDVIACEHNFTDQRNRIAGLLRRNGYERVAESLSKHDDWFIRQESEAFSRWLGS